ncbi:MAG: AGE family epimerase/isomerase [Bacteroidales bacterium]|nr:AGE family epimerase/isomerase [Bacteroidales bacterium]
MIEISKTPAELFASRALASQVRKELTENILPYWMKKMCNPSGGFHGRISGGEVLDTEAPVGGIMTARILWTYASAYRVLGASAPDSKAYLNMALRAKRLLIDRFYDTEFGGTYWSLNPDFSPLDTKKQIYAIAFTIYGLAELYRACGDEEALEYAVKLFHDIENHSFDSVGGGYWEAFTREWAPIEDMRLSDKDANESKTMNTHLHVLEAYTCLFRVWKDPLLELRLRGLIEIFEFKILGSDCHLRLFFDDHWNCGYDIVSYGHDIEASWLLHEAAIVLGDAAVLARVEALVPMIVRAASEGFTPDGGMIYEKEGTKVDADRHWWVQAESVVGYFNLWDHFGEQSGLEYALMCWEFIKNHLIDSEEGEWFWSLRADGSINRDDDKAGFWKCPYHNGRMCMEIIERVA